MMTLQKDASSYKAQKSGFSFLQSFDDDANAKEKAAAELLKQEQERLRRIELEQREMQARDLAFKQGYTKASTEAQGTYTDQLQRIRDNNIADVRKCLLELKQSKHVMENQIHSILQSVLDGVIPELYRPAYYSHIISEIETTLQMFDYRKLNLHANAKSFNAVQEGIDPELLDLIIFEEKSDYPDGKVNLRWSSGGYDFNVNQVLTSIGQIIKKHLAPSDSVMPERPEEQEEQEEQENNIEEN